MVPENLSELDAVMVLEGTVIEKLNEEEGSIENYNNGFGYSSGQGYGGGYGGGRCSMQGHGAGTGNGITFIREYYLGAGTAIGHGTPNGRGAG